jgi:hypothetical protein
MPYAHDIATGRQRSSSVARSKGTAPGALRKRVLADVKAEPERLWVRLGHGANRRLHGRALPTATLCVLALIAAAISLRPFQAPSRPLGKTSVTAELGGAHASLYRAGTHAELTISGMPQAPVGEVYEVWLAGRGDSPRATDALFTVTRAGAGSVEVPGSLHGVREVMVTAEPVGGSFYPTSPAVLSVLLGRSSSAD